MVLDTLAFREILRKICQHSPIIRIQKTKNQLIISSISTDELSFASIIFNKTFFKKWDGKTESSIEIESKTLYDVSKIIQAKSNVMVDLSGRRLQININDVSLKRITITGLQKDSATFEPLKIGKTKTSLKINSKAFRCIIGELNNLLDEAQLLFRKDSENIVFSGKQRGMTLEIILQYRSTANNIEEDISVEFPVKYLQHFSPLMCHFGELLLSSAPRAPLKIEGCNGKWKLVLIVSKIDKTIHALKEQ